MFSVRAWLQRLCAGVDVVCFPPIPAISVRFGLLTLECLLLWGLSSLGIRVSIQTIVVLQLRSESSRRIQQRRRNLAGCIDLASHVRLAKLLEHASRCRTMKQHDVLRVSVFVELGPGSGVDRKTLPRQMVAATMHDKQCNRDRNRFGNRCKTR
jgi:hypothetical protein